jgi:hypothetical protein
MVMERTKIYRRGVKGVWNTLNRSSSLAQYRHMKRNEGRADGRKHKPKPTQQPTINNKKLVIFLSLRNT